MPKADLAVTLRKRLQKLERAHAAIADLSHRVGAQADALRGLLTLIESIGVDGADRGGRRAKAKGTTGGRGAARPKSRRPGGA